MRVKYGVRYYRSLKILNIYEYFCINMYDMKDFVYFCIGFSYVKIGIYSERGLVPGIILQIVLIVHYCLSVCSVFAK